MMRYLCEIGDFIRRIRVQARFGTLSREPLRLLRLQLSGTLIECEWIAREADQWDASLPRYVRERNISAQALEDAITVKKLLFSLMPDVDAALLRVYRRLSDESPELIITGTVRRNEQPTFSVHSLVMRAKLCGLQFSLEDGILGTLRPDEQAVST